MSEQSQSLQPFQPLEGQVSVSGKNESFTRFLELTLQVEAVLLNQSDPSIREWLSGECSEIFDGELSELTNSIRKHL